VSSAVLTVIHHDRLNETWQVECAHGKVTEATVTDTGEAMEAAFALVMSRMTCRCPLAMMLDYWPSLATALEHFREDAKHPPTKPAVRQPGRVNAPRHEHRRDGEGRLPDV
jgi:hypothetical protein